LLAVLTQTWPGPPLGLGAVRWLVEAVGEGGGATGLIAVEAAPHDCTPPCPLQAPERFVPVKAVPSLQVAVTVFVSCARIAPTGSKRAAIRAKDSRELRIRAAPYALWLISPRRILPILGTYYSKCALKSSAISSFSPRIVEIAANVPQLAAKVLSGSQRDPPNLRAGR
jgi:hypothetical protein